MPPKFSDAAHYAEEAAVDEESGKPGIAVVCVAPPTLTADRRWNQALVAIKASLNDRNIDVPETAAWIQVDGNHIQRTWTGDEVLLELLETAYLIGMNSAPSITAYTTLGLLHTNEVTTGSFKAKSSKEDNPVSYARFQILPPSVAARSIVIVITVGGVKVTITIRW